jgi:hypothetical protein
LNCPIPEPGLVIKDACLWHIEHEAGRDKGSKNHPNVVVLTVERESDGATVVVVLPVTHSPPRDATSAVEIPAAVKRQLGLDDERSWVVVTEGNTFVWPGYDLRKIPNTDRFEYGFLPPRFLNVIRDAFVAEYKAGKARASPRT